MRDTPVIGHGEDVLAAGEAGAATVRGAVLRVGGYVFGVAISVISAALLFRHLGVADGGRYVTIVSIVALFGGLTEAGLASIAVREMAAGSGRALLADIVGLRIFLSVAAALGAVAFTAAAGYGSRLVVGAAVASAGMVIYSVQVTWSSVLTARLRFGWVAALDLIRQVMTVCGILVLVLAGAGVVPFLAVALPAALVTIVPTGLLIRRQIGLLPSFDRSVWRGLLHDVLPYAAATAVGAVYFRVSLVLVSLLTSEQETGYFSASFRVVEVLFGVPVLAVSTAFPIFARAANDDPVRLLFAVQRVADVTAILAAMVVVGVVVGAPGIIEILAGPDFAPAADVLRVQSLGLLGAFLAAVWGFALLSRGRHRTLLYLTCGPLVVNAGLTATLAPSYGAQGGAIATAVGELVLAAAGAVALSRELRPTGIRPGGIVRALAAAVPCTALALVPGVPTIPLAVAAIAAYLVLLWAIGGLPKDLLADLRAKR